ncbi:hypothetical protein NBRC10512_005225 [Rhodotorula toruloides]|uniref:RHTO0S13e00914g1_1 n=2 Tax=Rhodotorula toruloides TaxID=5286 RepID=A0A061BBN0_RHOTO|nr:uncharacterized protein RHTO_00825 [Rhodotorula toruloides NP11]EMS22546.1 hypothetical protein RHTO_00825 [Rhodotorula toruloides NP11]CDR46747.1 RHTO0S13e00914g1_1 [Rhodotorula toruloides]
MAAVAQQYNGFKDPFAANHQQSFGSYKLGSNKGIEAGGFGDSLAVQYELHDQQPYYQAHCHDKGYEYKQDNVPIARNNAGQLFVPSFDARNDKSNRIDSVLDAYVDMYAEDEEDEEDGSGEDLRGTAAGRTRQEDLEPYESHVQSDTPWDERGKSGLYGGGGRGADDRETGWVRDYAFSPAPPVSGYEEDLRFDNDDGEESQQHSSHDQHRQSSETSGSSTGPLTPTNGVDFGSACESALRQTQATARSSPPLHEQPIHTVDPARIKKKTIGAAIPTPSAPMPALASSGVKGAREDRPRVQRKTTFKLIGRSKKPPTISAPILPEGFVESLGMETFPLYPGVKAPQHALLSPSLKEDRPSTPPASSPRPAATGGLVSASPRIRSPPTRKAAPRPKHVPTRAEGSTPPLRDRPISPPVVAQVREQHFSTRGYDDDDEPQPRQQQQQQHQQYTRPTTSPPRSSPSRAQQHEASPPFEQYSGSHARTASSATVGSGFRDPWSATRTSSGTPSIRSQSTAHNRTSPSRAGERGSMASTVHELDYRKGGSVKSNLSSHARPVPTFQLEVADDFEPSPLQRTTDDRQGSLSSEYSELSEAPPTNNFHPSNAFSGYTPSTTVGQLRKNSIAYAPVQPLKLGARPAFDNRQSTASNFGGDVVWGGPTDVSRPQSVASPFQGYAPTIGTTGFRNPFG